jgi:phage-related protein
MGPRLRAPHTRALGGGLHELRFDIDTVAWRITYWFAPSQVIVLLTVFRKQRMNERTEIERARRALATCRRSHLTEEDG